MNQIKLSYNYHRVDTANLPLRWWMDGYAVVKLLTNPKYNGVAELIRSNDPLYPKAGPGMPICKVTFERARKYNILWRAIELIKLIIKAVLTSPIFLISYLKRDKNTAYPYYKELATDYKIRWRQFFTGIETRIYQIDIGGARGFSYDIGKSDEYNSLDDIVKEKKWTPSNTDEKNTIKLAKLSYVFHYLIDKSPESLRYNLPKTDW